jgi:integrase
MRLDEAIRLFINNYENPNTQRSYSSCLLPMVDYIGGGRPIEDIQPVHLIEYNQSLSKDLAQATVGKIYKTIKTFFNFYVKLGVIPTSPAHILKIKRRNTYVPKSKAMPDYVLETIIDFAKWDKRKYALILFLADTGCRAGGAAGLRVCDIDLTRMEAKVTEKGNKTRTVWYDEDCRDALSQLIRDMPLHAYVFGRNGKQTTSSVLSQTIRRTCRSAGVTEYGSHSLRHRKGHKLADAGIPVTVACVVLGHDNHETTGRHYYPYDEERATAAARLTSTRNLVRSVIRPLQSGNKKTDKTGS